MSDGVRLTYDIIGGVPEPPRPQPTAVKATALGAALLKIADHERRIAELEAQVAELKRRLDERDGDGK